jgi:hypothetical protein
MWPREWAPRSGAFSVLTNSSPLPRLAVRRQLLLTNVSVQGEGPVPVRFGRPQRVAPTHFGNRTGVLLETIES